jgi:hypothetical protein
MATQMVKVAGIKDRRVAHIGRLSEQLWVVGVRELKLGRGAPACDTRVDLALPRSESARGSHASCSATGAALLFSIRLDTSHERRTKLEHLLCVFVVLPVALYRAVKNLSIATTSVIPEILVADISSGLLPPRNCATCASAASSMPPKARSKEDRQSRAEASY